MNQAEYDKWRIARYKQHLRTVRAYFNTDKYSVGWGDAANDISRTLAQTPDKIENSIFRDCVIYPPPRHI